MAVEPLEYSLMQVLQTAGVGTFEATSGWGIYIGREPTTPDSTITLYRTGGFPPNPKWNLDYPSVQARLRGSKGNYKDTWLKAKDVKDVLLGLQSQDLNGDRFVSITMPGDIHFIAYDDNERPLFTMNFNLIIEPQVVGLSNRQAI